jgi:hypothetical protein
MSNHLSNGSLSGANGIANNERTVHSLPEPSDVTVLHFQTYQDSYSIFLKTFICIYRIIGRRARDSNNSLWLTKNILTAKLT